MIDFLESGLNYILSMTEIRLLWGGTSLLEIVIDVANIRGVGGPAFPRLLVPLKLNFSKWEGYRLVYQALSVQLATKDGRVIADAAPQAFAHRVEMSFPTYHQLEFSLDHHRLETIESERGANSLFLQLTVQSAVTAVYVGDDSYKPTLGEGLHPLTGMTHFQIPANAWCENVAPGLGIGLIKVFELPAVPLEAIEDYDRAFRSLDKAQKLFAKGEYDDAVAECRKAIEPLRSHLKKVKLLDPDILPADYADKIGSATAEWLLTMIGKTHGVASALHHSTTVHFSRLDAQMVLTITVSLVAYVLRSAKEMP